MRHLLIALIRLYQLLGVPFLKAITGPGGCCRFEPSCSHYAIEALRTHGSLRGGLLAAWRVARCNPWGGSGFDPVPPRRTGIRVERVLPETPAPLPPASRAEDRLPAR